MADKKDDKKRNYPRFTTTRGTFVFPKLNEPDYGNKQYPKPDGEYSLKLRVSADDPEVKAFLKKVEPHYKEAMKEAEAAFKELKAETRKKLGSITRNPLFTELLDQETEQPTGEIEFKFAMKASGETKKGPKAGKRWNRKPVIFDSRGQPMEKVPAIWSGTIGKVTFEASPYFIPGTGAAGLKLGLVAAQVIKLVSGGQSKDAKDYGFGAEDDGYEYDPGEGDDAGGGDAGDDADGGDAGGKGDGSDF